MPHATTVEESPPFPDDVPTIELPCLSLTKLLANDAAECKTLYEKCKNPGCFILDLEGVSYGEELVRQRDQIYNLMQKFFDQDDAKKQAHPMNRMTAAGYKPLGATQADKKGNPDSNEFYTVTELNASGDDVETRMPEMISSELPLFGSFMYNAHAVTLDLLRPLSSSLHLPPDTLPSLHRQDRQSSSQTRIIKYHPPQQTANTATTFPSHTDLGSVTVLFTSLGGLQFIHPDVPDIPENWLYVKPPSDTCCIVNIGDTLAKYTGGVFNTARHRVIAPPGEQAGHVRYSLAYFARPDQRAPMKTLQSDLIPKVEGEEEMTVMKWYFHEFLKRQKNNKNLETALDAEPKPQKSSRGDEVKQVA